MVFSCVCFATLCMLSWAGLGGVGGWDVNFHGDVLTCHLLATGLYLCLLGYVCCAKPASKSAKKMEEKKASVEQMM